MRVLSYRQRGEKQRILRGRLAGTKAPTVSWGSGKSMQCGVRPAFQGWLHHSQLCVLGQAISWPPAPLTELLGDFRDVGPGQSTQWKALPQRPPAAAASSDMGALADKQVSRPTKVKGNGLRTCGHRACFYENDVCDGLEIQDRSRVGSGAKLGESRAW